MATSEAKSAYMREYYRKNPEKFRRTPEKRDRVNAARRERYRSDPAYRNQAKESAKKSRDQLKRKLKQYGITADQYELMRNKGCSICGGSFEELGEAPMHIDHDHHGGRTRGALCQSCNLAIGHMQDDPIIVAAALRYLMNEGDDSWR